MAKPEYFKSIRLSGKTLDLANELIADFQTRGLRASYTSIVNAAVPVLHQGMISKEYRMWTNAQIAEQRAHAAGTSIATILITLCRAQVSMAGCQLGYYPEVDCIGIRLDCHWRHLSFTLQGADSCRPLRMWSLSNCGPVGISKAMMALSSSTWTNCYKGLPVN